MPWVPIQESEVPFTFAGGFAPAVTTLTNSIASFADAPYGGEWSVTFESAQDVRITTQQYSSSYDPSQQYSYFYWAGGQQLNTAAAGFPGPGDVTAFTPTPFEIADVTSFNYGFEGSGHSNNIESYAFLIEVWIEPVDTSYNCTCDDENNNKTLGELKNKMMHLLGWGATAANPPPGVAQMLTYWLQDAQEMLYRRFTQLRTERFFSWPLVQGVRLYDLPENQEACTKKLDPRKLTWVGIERDGIWTPLISSIPPELYSYNTMGYPIRYEIRQCIEVWPTPDATLGNLIIKGHFGLEPFADDADKTTIDSLPVFLLAIASAKEHYRQPDAKIYVQKMEALIRDLTAGLHGTRRYWPGQRLELDYVYNTPRPTVPFPPS